MRENTRPRRAGRLRWTKKTQSGRAAGLLLAALLALPCSAQAVYETADVCFAADTEAVQRADVEAAEEACHVVADAESVQRAGVEAAADARAVYARHAGLEIDTQHVYENMQTSYAQGYIPVVENDTVHLVVPFLANGSLKGERLSAGLSMTDNAPFVYANFQKEIKKEVYFFEERTEVYLFQCDITLKKARKNGQYPVTVYASGYTEEGIAVRESCRLYITITDRTDDGGQKPGQPGTQPDTEPEQPDTQPGQPGTQPDTEPEQPDTQPQPEQPGTQPDTEPEQPGQPGTQPDTQPGQPDTQPDTEPEQPDTEEPPTEPVSEDPSALSAGDGYVGGGAGGYGGGDYGGGTAETEKIYHQPKMLLESYSLSGQRIRAGQKKEFEAVFINKSRSDSIYNLKVTLKPADSGLTLSKSSFYFDRVAPQETITLSAWAEAAADASPGGQTITFSFEYENEKGTVYSAEEEVFLEVSQPAQAQLAGFSIASEVYSQETVESAVQIRNTGKTAIYRAHIRLEAPGLFATEELDAGTVEAGAAFEGSMRIYVGNKNMESIAQYDAQAGEDAYGQTAGTLTLTYEDAYGETYTQTQEFTTFIEEPQVVELTAEKEEEQKNGWYGAVLVSLTLLFLLTVAILAVRLKRSRDRVADLLALQKREQSG
ncbi:hypothetical protein BRYFOR_07011 [Marvinbryantia formatexigens DSM 14469]|uniref:CARDB domain-containing protein n=1 Tax=Marvinbryantia formatexigens DSM 14469 TaxID=478749 RepID=C6LEG2_9FIRM|nr:hypothetical protein [Marvinbryantia formatexigens]EET60945.1 hypothetical protein BRYFOR_07011 [Marvinbryantia formatexigens DSM 14469]UWO24759.1 hypothetical protein NQ534_20500 [Marvinbryantia formatexigens DSM 14469]SDF22225.1 hypothetical protein SAMN05660368_00375 [Marvinbryantia formatexigens]